MKMKNQKHHYITTNFAKTPGQVDYVTRRVYEISKRLNNHPSDVELAISREREGFSLNVKVKSQGKIFKNTLYGETLMDAFDSMESNLAQLA